jgi:hypothetical protein
MKSYLYSSKSPSRVGFYWYRHSKSHESTIIEIYKDEGDSSFSVRFGNYDDQTDFLENYNGEFAGPIERPINE